MDTERIIVLLRRAGFRATPGRIELVAFLKKAPGPQTAEELQKEIGIDLVTVYRNMRAFSNAGLIRETRLNDATSRYEFMPEDSQHHHHVVCTGCGKVDELPECALSTLQEQALKNSRRFLRINDHALEFFGTCRSCA